MNKIHKNRFDKKWAKSGQMTRKSGQNSKIAKIELRKICEKLKIGQKKWANGHFYLKSGQAVTIGAQGFAGFLATFPLFFSYLLYFYIYLTN